MTKIRKIGIPPAGTTGQVLKKTNNNDFEVEWGTGGVGGATNLAYTAATRVVSSDTGTDATLTLADVTNPGLLSSADFTKLSNLSGTNTGDNAVNSNYSGLAASKQDTLVSATNIKTINGSSVLGAGDLVVSGAQPDIPLTKRTPTANQTITAGYSGYISGFYEIGNGLTLEIANTGIFEIG